MCPWFHNMLQLMIQAYYRNTYVCRNEEIFNIIFSYYLLLISLWMVEIYMIFCPPLSQLSKTELGRMYKCGALMHSKTFGNEGVFFVNLCSSSWNFYRHFWSVLYTLLKLSFIWCICDTRVPMSKTILSLNFTWKYGTLL